MPDNEVTPGTQRQDEDSPVWSWPEMINDPMDYVPKGGFSFGGVDIASLGLTYVPTPQETFVFRPQRYTVHQQTFEGHDGGYYYGTTVPPKDFSLRCIFQQQDISTMSGINTAVHTPNDIHNVLLRVMDVFKRGVTKKLIFANDPHTKPAVGDNVVDTYYVATVINVDYTQISNYQNGFITINLRAYYPFARACDYINHTLSGGGSTIDYAGTEWASVAVKVNSHASGTFYVRNETTGETCLFKGLNGLGSGEWIECDALNGKTSIYSGVFGNSTGTSRAGYLYHDSGFIHLKPGVVNRFSATNPGSVMISYNDTYP